MILYIIKMRELISRMVYLNTEIELYHSISNLTLGVVNQSANQQSIREHTTEWFDKENQLTVVEK